MNDNDRTEQLLVDLRLPASRVELVRFFGHEGKGMTVKRVISRRARPDLPYLFLVTSKARMGDQFPSDVRYFIDLSTKSSDLNSLLQGLVGRACGYGKNSLVILSNANHRLLKQFVATQGGYVMQPSRHSVVAGGASPPSVRQQLMIDRDPSDLRLEAFFKDLDREVVAPLIPRSASYKPKRARGGSRRGPILTLAEKHGLIDYLESDAFRAQSLRHVLEQVDILRRGETLTLTDADGAEQTGEYLTDEAGGCRFNFRQEDQAGRAGVKGRGRGQRDAADLTQNLGIVEPSVGVGKRAGNGERISDPAVEGQWVASSITFPLCAPCLMSDAPAPNRTSLPAPLCVYDKHMTDGERARRDGTAAIGVGS